VAKPTTAAVVLGLVLGVLTPSPTASRAAPASDPPEPIHLLRIAVQTTAASARLFVRRPAELITADARSTGGAAQAAFQRFGRGPLMVVRRGGARVARATFLAAIALNDANRLRFRSVKQGQGEVAILVGNRNVPPAQTIRAESHDAGVSRFSIPAYAVAAGGPAPGTDPLPPTVLAFYYPWYSLGDWTGGKPIAPYNVNPTPYDSGDLLTIDRHIRQATAAGLDGFVVSWAGRESGSNRNVEAFAARVPPGFRFAILLELFSPAFQSEEGIAAEIDYVLDAYATSDRYLQIGGRPVVYAFSTHNVMTPLGTPGKNPRYREIWERVFRLVAAEGHDPLVVGEGRRFDVEDFGLFGGMHEYGTLDPSRDARRNHEMALTARAWAAVHGGPRRIWGAPVIPGYDDRHIPGRRVAYHFPREEGALYRAQWDGAIRSTPDQVLVVSFNEWMETTNIEPNTEWGQQYLALTAEHAARFKASD
jgi:hypothetical protein